MRIRLSYVLAAALAAGISWYMLTGKTVVGGQADNGYPSIAERQQAAAAPVAVQVELHEAEERTARLEVRGRTQAAALVEVRAQTAGTVEARAVAKGQAVAPGDLLCVIERGARESRLAQARAQLQQAEVDFEARSALVERGHAPRNQLPPLQSALAAARAAVAEAELEL
jgi:membrane fusion protein, multidrug efflux system